MYLKKIEIQGFKSFANKTVLDFESGITAIVGPNGSGKSNVADAVRWVLGEQRIKQLRSDHMQDVIFAGTENRKALSYAAVAITMDNSDHSLAIDYEEVTVTRKLYRSGESEYLLNGTNCRLKDINELFYDTGIGKEGYSIIGQGQIERIVNGKAEERRELFDEAVGIVKYKKRKTMTQKKLETERANLTRVTDILTELEGQLKPLEKEAEKAKVYLNKKDELKRYDINLFLVEMKRLQEQTTELSALLKTTQEELEETQTNYDATKSAYQEIEDEVDAIDNLISAGKDKLTQTTLLKQQLENRIEVLTEQIRSVKLSDENAEKRVQAITEEKENKTKELAALTEQEHTTKASLSSDEKRLQEKEAERDRMIEKVLELESSVEDRRSAVIFAVSALAEANAAKEQIHLQIEEANARKQKLLASADEFAGIEASLNDEMDQVLKEIASLTKKHEEKQKRQKEVNASLSEISKILASENETLREKESAWNREKSRLESLKAMTERYEGYGNSVRRVMEQKEFEKGIIGVVADIIKTKKRYQLAIETTLGGSIQNIIVDHEDTAKRLIGFLKENRYGRATFLPLNGTKHNKPLDRKDVLSETGVIGIASSLVEADTKYDGIIAYLLGRTFIVDTVDHAIQIARKYKYSLRMVTLEGEALNPQGSISGGAFRNSNNFLSRGQEIEDLTRKTRTLLEAYETAKADNDAHKKTRASYYEELESLTKEIHELELSYHTNRMQQEAIESRKAELSESRNSFEQEKQAIQDRLNSLSIELDTATSRIAELSDTQKVADQTVEQQNAELTEARNLRSKLRQESEAIRVSNSQHAQNLDFLAENQHRIREEIKHADLELAEISSQKESASAEITQKQQEIDDLNRTIEDSKELFEELNQEIAENTAKKEALASKHKKFISEREYLSQKLADLDKEQFRLSSRKENAENALQQQISYMWEEYEITPARAEALKDESLNNLAEIKKMISSIRNEIRNLGNINVGAIESFKEMSTRYEFLSTQRNDLIEAEEKLIGIIEELDEGMRNQFRTKFAEIQVKFNEVFQKLFGGGKGTLTLSEEEDILESGISIIAQPPGKKLQNMVLLSGGEKSLTAIALLFAIQSMKPSPFCLLDEIEAALDDANVDRFASYLDLLTKHTQFIMITHRRGTMAAADRLYGITMQEKGISALVSVDFDKLTEEQEKKLQNQQEG